MQAAQKCSTRLAAAALLLAGLPALGAAQTVPPAAAAPAAVTTVATAPAERSMGRLEQVFVFRDAMPTGVTVAENGRIFVNFPRWGDRVEFTVAEIRDGRLQAYPDLATNRFDPARPAQGLLSVQSVVADGQGRVWALDTAAPGFAAPLAGAAKLVAIDLKSDKVVKTIAFAADVVLPTSYVNDMRFDFRVGAAGVAYVTDSSPRGPGALIVVDLASGRALRRLSGHRSTSADPDFVPVVEGQQLMARGADGSARRVAIAADGIALSADGQTLYFCPLSSRHLFAVPTRLLRDPAVSEQQLAAAVRDLGEKGASDGLEADAAGNLYAGDYEHNSLNVRSPDGRWRTLVHDPRLLWPDTLSIGPDGYLYVTANQLHRQPGFHGGQDLREKAYSLFRVKIDAAPAPTR